MGAQELRWPPGWPRARSRNDWGGRFNHQGRQITIERAEQLLRSALRRISATRVAITLGTGGQDPGAAVYFTRGGKQLVIACDRYCIPAANLRSIGIAVEAMQQLERHGGGAMMDRAFSGFVALPAPDQAPPRSHWDVLGTDPGVGPDEIERAYRARAKERHPDAGGSNEAMAELNDARRRALSQPPRI